MRKILITAIALFLSTSSGVQAFDPFASPPKNMQAQGQIQPNNQLSGPVGFPPPPPSPSIVDFGSTEPTHSAAEEESFSDIPAIGSEEESYTGALTLSDEEFTDDFYHYILDTGLDLIPVTTKKDLEILVGQNVTIDVERNGDTLSIARITLSESASLDFSDMNIEENPPVGNPEDALHNASTGPESRGVTALGLLLVVGAIAFLLYIRRKKRVPVIKEKNEDTPYQP